MSLTGYAGGLGYQEKFSHFFHTAASSRNWFGNCFIGLNITIPIFDANSKRLQISQHRYDAEMADNNAQLLRVAQSACVQAHCQFNLAQLDLLRLSGNLPLLTR